MTLLTPDHNQQELAARLSTLATPGNGSGPSGQGGRLVACLCAEWCGTCKSYRETFATLAAQHPDDCFVWIDIETHADHLGDVDIENFPTLLIQSVSSHEIQFFGTVLPHANVVSRMLERTESGGAATHSDAPEVLAWLRNPR